MYFGFGCGGISCFYVARPSVHVRSRRMRFHLMYSGTAEYSRKACPSTTHDPTMCVQQQYSSTTAEKKAKTQRRGDSTDALSRIECSIVEPTENVTITSRLREGNFEKSSLAEWLRCPFFRRGSRGLLCGWYLARSRGLGGSGGAREQPVLKKHA